ncbi:MAG: complex I subunit 5 family protein [candidate division WOR-3 bacterium]|nr:complex I subunit 5 family protein [candidate division WOR-3 bacterium]MCX7837342.1 complex I subunit 5 family protein [candidate division WOR-3 bacterium]MDW8113818.1 complex I subunit 5 family protein [candidate division WOR-3 bacterium]
MIFDKNFINQYLLFTFALPFLATLIYSFEDRLIRNFEFYIFLILLALSSYAIIISNNLLLIYIFFEISTLATWRLVLIKRENIKAGNYLLYFNFAGAILMLIGISLLLIENGIENITFEAFDLRNIYHISFLSGILLSCGIFTKSAIIPFYNWLPIVYEVSPIPIIALLCGIAENLGLILFYKIFISNWLEMEISFYHFIIILAIFTSIIAGGIAYFEKELKRILAYSTISQLSFILFGLALKNDIGIIGAFILILSHALAKPGLFYKMEAKEDGSVNFGLALLSLSLMGIPPFLGFIGKLLIIIGSLKLNILLGVSAIISSLFTLLYSLKFYPLLKKEKGENIIATSIVYIFGLLLLILGTLFLIYFLKIL